MIVRIVKMTFAPNKINAFLKVFSDAKNKILDFEGCTHLELFRDAEQPAVYFTLSHWTMPENLESYRKSELFRKTWIKTKALFVAKPEAWSLAKTSV